MTSQKKLTVVFGIIFATAVLFFIGIVVFASLYGEEITASQTVDTAFRINEMRVDVDWRNDRSCKIKQELAVKFSEERHGIYVDIPVNSGERVRNLDVKVTDKYGNNIRFDIGHESGNRIVRVKVGDAAILLEKNEQLFCTVQYDCITPEHPDDKNALDINAIGNGWTCYIDNAVVTVNLPKSVSDSAVTVWVGGEERNVALTNGGKTIMLTTGKLSPFNGVRVKAIMPSGTLKSSSFEGVITVVVGVALVAAVILLMVFLGKDKPLTPIVSFYPPQTDGKNGRKRRMLPVQLGKIIDGACSSSDVTSLIFYWASEGYISIEEKDGDTYLTKLKDVDPVKEYERTLFNRLFKNAASKSGEDNKLTVSVNSLSGNFADHIKAVKNDVNTEYRGKFFKGGFTALSVGIVILTALYAVLGSVLCTLRIASGFYNPVGILTVAPVVLACILGTMLVRAYFKLGDMRRKVFLVLYLVAVILVSIAVMLAVPTDAMVWTEKIIFAICIGGSAALAPFLTRRKDQYTEQLNEVIGFRNFLRDAEKSQLEMMLKDDPQYYYNILPYANVLGVSKIWQDKFEGLSIEPPTYYYYGGDSNVSLFDIYILSRLTASIGSSLTYTPPKVNAGSFSGKFFGGGGGGGGSFGGFGGGGGGSW